MKIEFSKKFSDQRDNAPVGIQTTFLEKLRIFKKDPYAPMLRNHKLKGKWTGWRSINIGGDWRAIYYHVSQDTVSFDAIGTHSQLYG